MVGVRHACTFAVVAGVAVAACVSSGRWPRLAEGARYEVQNPTVCPARVYTATENNVTRRYLGEVPSGGRGVFAVPPRSEGTRVVAMALYRDGADCDTAGRLRVRLLKP